MSIKTFARNGDIILYEDENKQRYFVNIHTEETQKTDVVPAAVITKYNFDIYEEEFSELEELIGFELSLEEHMKTESECDSKTVTELICPFCLCKKVYIIENNKETLCCLNCFQYINIIKKDGIVRITKTKKNCNKYGFGNSKVYKFILLYLNSIYPYSINLRDLIQKIKQVSPELLNPIEDTVNKLIYGSKYIRIEQGFLSFTSEGKKVIETMMTN